MGEVLKTTTALTAPDSIGGYVDDIGGSGMQTPSGFLRRFNGLMLKLDHKTGQWIDNYERDVSGMEVILTDIVRRNVKWVDSRMVDGHDLKPGEKFPDTNAQNTACDKSEWKDWYGKQTGPWSNDSVVTFFNPKTGLDYWWPARTTTSGATRCVREIAAAIKRNREFRGARVYPIVKLGHVFQKSETYGGCEIPHLEILDWVVWTHGGEVAAAPDMPKLTRMEPVTLAEEVKDKIPY